MKIDGSYINILNISIKQRYKSMQGYFGAYTNQQYIAYDTIFIILEGWSKVK